MSRINQAWIKRYGLNLKGDTEERRDIRRFNKKLWSKRKAKIIDDHTEIIKQKIVDPSLIDRNRVPVKYIPGFLKSLEELSLYGYSYSDIGDIYGMSRQRIQQIFKENELNHGSKENSYFIFSDEENRFVPISPGEFKERIKKNIEENARYLVAKRARDKKSEHIEAIIDFANIHGRAPYLKELGKMVGAKWISSQLFYYWAEPGDSYSTAADRPYREAGFERPNGRSVRALELRVAA